MASTPSQVPARRPAARVLIADDDAASRRYLGDTLVALGAEATACADGPQALDLARIRHFDLLLLDCRMPGAGALEVLSALRGGAGAASSEAIAVATTAEPDIAMDTQLAAAGFRAVLRKPCDMAQLRGILLLVPGASPLLDDTAALRTTGNAATLQALRTLLHAELESLRRELVPLAAQPAALDDRLHRLRSSCGFCGAPALAAATARLQHRLRSPATINASTLTAFDAAIGATLKALGAGDGTA